MNSVTGQFEQSFTTAWVSNSGAVALGVSSRNLAPEQIGIYQDDPSCSGVEALSLTTPSFKGIKRVKIKQGLAPFAGGNSFALTRASNIPRETFSFTAEDIVSWEGVKGQKGSKEHRIALGYDGLDTDKSLNAKLDAKPILFTFVLEGDPIQRYFGQNRIIYEYTVDKGLCQSDCNCIDTCGKVDCKLIQENLFQAMSYQYPRVLGNGIVVRRPITDFVKINSISKCEVDPTPPTLTTWEKWQISICDDGATTLGRLGAAYPNKKITLESRVDSISTYSFWQIATDADPADFVMTTYEQPICGVCPTCPVEFTSVAEVKVVEVRKACGASAPVVTNAITTTLISSTLGGGDVYIVKTTVATSDVTIAGNLTGCVDFKILPRQTQLCVGTNVTFEWATCNTCSRTTKDWMITIGDKDCGTATWLAELQAAYPELVIATDLTGTCIHTYRTTTISNCLPAELCTLERTFEFEAPTPFKGQAWEEYRVIDTTPDCEVDAVVEPPCCSCGLVLEGKVFTRNFIECTKGWETYDPNEVLGVRIHATATSYDYTDNPCDLTKEFVTTLQLPQVSRGASGLLVQKYEKAQLAYENKYFDTNPFVNQIDGFNLVAKPHVYYDTYKLKLKRRGHEATYIENFQDHTTFHFYVPQGQGKTLETLINSLVLSAGNPKLHAVVL